MLLKTFTTDEVKANNGKNGSPVWIIIKNSVYDVTTYMEKHPGGSELLQEWAGRDATKAFNESGHSSDATRMLKNYEIGKISKEISCPAIHIGKEFVKENKQKRRIKLFFCM